MRNDTFTPFYKLPHIVRLPCCCCCFGHVAIIMPRSHLQVIKVSRKIHVTWLSKNRGAGLGYLVAVTRSTRVTDTGCMWLLRGVAVTWQPPSKRHVDPGVRTYYDVPTIYHVPTTMYLRRYTYYDVPITMYLRRCTYYDVPTILPSFSKRLEASAICAI